MDLTERSVMELESVLAQHEEENGVVRLEAFEMTDCQCTGSMCSTGCQGNKGQKFLTFVY